MKHLRAELVQLRSSNIEEQQHQQDEEAEENVFAPPAPHGGTLAEEQKAEEGTCKALECVRFVMAESRADVEKEGFAPGFAHQHFEDDETIRGYRNVSIRHLYASASLFLSTQVRFSERLPGAMDLDAILREYMPDPEVEAESVWGASSVDVFVQHLESENESFEPPGKQVANYQGSDGRRYQVRWGKFSDPAMRRYHQRMRPFMIWFVDGARFLDDTDSHWDVFMLFREPEKPGGGPLCFAGYVTCYSFFAWSGAVAEPLMERAMLLQAPQVASPAVEQIVASIVTGAYDNTTQETNHAIKPWYERRFRISQFLILPPFQRSGHGARLFEIVYQWAALHYAPLRDITVEDPSPNFVGLRDFCDLSFLVKEGLVKLNTLGNNQEVMAAALKARHTCAAQISRVGQIVQWMEAKITSQEAMDAMRVAIKKRLYKENSADIPDNETKLILTQLWNDEQASFDATLKRVARI